MGGELCDSLEEDKERVKWLFRTRIVHNTMRLANVHSKR